MTGIYCCSGICEWSCQSGPGTAALFGLEHGSVVSWLEAGTGCSRKGMAHLPGGRLALILTSVVSEHWISHHVKGPSKLVAKASGQSSKTESKRRQ